MDIDAHTLLTFLEDEISSLRDSDDGLDENILAELTAATRDDLLKDQLWGWRLDAPPMNIESFFADEWARLAPEASAFVVAGIRALQRLHDQIDSTENHTKDV